METILWLEKSFNEFRTLWGDFDDRARIVATAYADIKKHSFSPKAEVSWDWENEWVWFNWSCGREDYDGFRIPMRYLYQANWQDELKAEVEEERRRKEEEKQARDGIERTRLEQIDRRTYERLKKKYEGVER